MPMKFNYCDCDRPVSRRGRTSFIVLGLLVFGLLAVYGIRILFGEPSISSLRDEALNGSTPQIQREAARQLADRGEDALDDMRDVLKQSDNPDVVSICMAGLARQLDDICMDVFLEKLDDPSINVRVAAAKACTKILGRNHHFPADGTADQRKRIKNNMAEDWESYNGSELHEFNKKRFKKDDDN